MRKRSARVVATGFAGFVLAGIASVAVPGVANAGTLIDAAPAEPRPTVAGDCAATLAGEAGEPVTVDAGAPLGTGGVLDLGLGSASRGTGGATEAPVAKVPLADAVQLLGADEVPVVPEVATQGCEVVSGALNTTGNTTQVALLAGDPRPGTDPAEPGDDPGTDPGDDPAQPEPEPGDSAQPAEETTEEPSAPDAGIVGHALPVAAPLPDLHLAGVPALGELPTGPKLGVDARTSKETPNNSGLADAMPVSNGSSNRLPYALAVVTLAVVAASLVRRWVVHSH